ncbi:polyprenyl synthetase family protein [Candidatus Woesearchaeota archaeon]|nr:polyprenyl synthetase family protein [Candidatus Woesearchaeota archaeon]
MDAIKVLGEYKKRIDSALGDFFDKKINEAEAIDSSAVEIMKNLKDFNLRGGKRIRPALMIHGYKCFSDADDKKDKDLIRFSLAAELMEGFFLIHDDVLDQDELRRGGPTFHAIYRERFNDSHFGEGVAIVAGDMQNSLANEIIAEAGSVELLKQYHKTALRTEYGWLIESMLTKKPIDEVTEEDVMKVNMYKTSAYTIEGPLIMGATLAGAGEKNIKILSDFAIPLGQAFQIQDDILGMFGDEKKLGKPVGSDIREGKVTLLIVKALEKASEEDKKELLSALGKKDITIEEIERLRKIINDCSSLDYSKRMAEEMIEKAKKALENADFRKEGKDFLEGIADFLINREY